MTTLSRLERLQAELPSLGVDGLLVTELHNVRYLTGSRETAPICW